MTRPYAIIGSALAAAVINVSGALALIFALAPEAGQTEPRGTILPRSINCHQFPPAPIGDVPNLGVTHLTSGHTTNRNTTDPHASGRMPAL